MKLIKKCSGYISSESQINPLVVRRNYGSADRFKCAATQVTKNQRQRAATGTANSTKHNSNAKYAVTVIKEKTT
jgi:hypothetical protein